MQRMQRINADQPEKESAEIRCIRVIRVSIRWSNYAQALRNDERIYEDQL